VREATPAPLRRPWSPPAAAVLAAALLAVLQACSRSPGEDHPAAAEGEALERRAREYLELKQRHEWERIYDDLLAPEDRKKLERQHFLRKRASSFDVLDFDVVTVEKEGKGSARVAATMVAMIPVLKPGGETTLVRKRVRDEQRWVYRDGRWYIHLES